MKYFKLSIFRFSILAVLIGIWSCGPAAGGLAPTQEGPGPHVIFDLAAKPLPEIPLPNDAAMVIDPTTNTGLRVNISEISPTLIESDTRSRVDKIDGFGVFSPITVSFDRVIDLGDLLKRHANTKFADDAVFVINVDPKSKYYGTFAPVDICHGNYPVTVTQTGNHDLFFSERPPEPGTTPDPNKVNRDYMWQADVHAWDNNVLYEERNEDTNHNGLLDPGEDTDFDNQLDFPNIYPLHVCDTLRDTLRQALLSNNEKNIETARKAYDTCMVAHLLTCYERETNTLIIKPLVPLQQHSKYAVVITKRLRGKDGNPVVSPFPSVNALDQTKTLEPLRDILPKVGLSINDVAFAWSFTTQSLTEDMEAIRKGLYGFGTMSWLSKQFPVSKIYPAVATDAKGARPYYINMKKFLDALGPVLPMFGSDTNKNGPKKLVQDLGNVDHIVIGKFYSPYFLVDKDGVATKHYPADDDESFEMNPLTGKAVVGGQWVGYMCTVPKDTKLAQQPFPVVLYAHGYLGLTFEQLGFAGRMAAFGMASCCIEATGHGLALPKDMKEVGLVKTLLKAYHLWPTWLTLSPGRARDLNNDGYPDIGGDFWTYDLFHTRDVVRQTLVDHMQFIRMLRSFNGENTWDADTNLDGFANLAGDFDGDGKPDFGGPKHPYGAWGQSLGGFVAALLAALDPAIDTVAPVSGGAGLTDIAIRSQNAGVPESVMLPLLGPIIMAHPDKKDDSIHFEFLLNDLINKAIVPIYTSTKIRPGDRLVLKNLHNGKTAYVIVPPSKIFRFAVAADALSATEKRAPLGMLDNNSNVPVTVTDPLAIADPLQITVYDNTSDRVKEVINHFDRDVLWQGALFPAGSPMVAIQKGMGYLRQTHDLRKMLSTAAFILEAGDPGAFGKFFYQDSLDFSYEDKLPDNMGHFSKKNTHILVTATAGDMFVPVNTEIAMARATSILGIFADVKDAKLAGVPESIFRGSHKAWPKLGITNPNDLLIKLHAVDPIDRLYGMPPDPDNLANGNDPNTDVARVDPPLRETVPWNGGFQAFRMAYHAEGDRHGIDIPEPDRCKDIATRDHCFDTSFFMTNEIAYWMYTHGNPVDASGKFILDSPCMEHGNCKFFPKQAISPPLK